MQIIDIIKSGCNLLGLGDELALLEAADSGDETSEETLLQDSTISRLFNLCRFSIQEICTNYQISLDTQTITTTDRTYSIKNLTNFIRMHGAKKDGKKVRFKLNGRNLVFREEGEYEICYCTYPEITSIFDEIDFVSNISLDLYVYGLCAYYCLAVGMFDDFKDFHERYTEKAEKIKELRIFELPEKRWV